MPVFPTLDFIQIKARYPKAVTKITEWIFNQPELQSVTDEFIDKKKPEESKEMFTGLLIQMDPRKLYDIFDALGIYVAAFPRKGKVGFSYYVDTFDNGGEIYETHSRHSAEVSAFHDAFETLEKQL